VYDARVVYYSCKWAAGRRDASKDTAGLHDKVKVKAARRRAIAFVHLRQDAEYSARVAIARSPLSPIGGC
jgi:hypothetical protein